jgi:hypothetical protein
MSDFRERIIACCLEAAEAAFEAAPRLGFSDPVIQLWAMDLDDPERVSMMTRERAETARSFEGLCDGAAACLAGGPEPGKPLTLVIVTPGGVTIINQPMP